MIHIREMSAFLALAALVLLVFPAKAGAQDSGGVMLPPQGVNIAEYDAPAGDVTHPMMRLTPDKSEIVRLETDAKSLIVGNPLHLSVTMDDTRTLILTPREPGSSMFTVLDAEGRIVMQRHVIVAAPTEKYVRIRRACANSTAGNCAPTRVYYCPDMCHETMLMGAYTPLPAMNNGGSVAPAGASGGLGTEETLSPEEEQQGISTQQLIDSLRNVLTSPTYTPYNPEE